MSYSITKNKTTNNIYPSSFKLLLCWLHSLTPVTELSMLPGMRSLVAALQLEIYWVYHKTGVRKE
ncbi:conserved hypothetical protein [Photorhabdus asymbiotica]|uniref:Uncharacterized protein n=1 Tax=Photorhabdus asymbiotica subsp. asymbiotica (strain ATCC 43949 / 3105-77) TaxID=553480 RepID=C7BLG7_PHOAA|nr:conserved hypothetical protein [Photorhabdus asymbiotica]